MIVIGSTVMLAGTVVIGLAQILRAEGEMIVQTNVKSGKDSVSYKGRPIQRLHGK